MDSVEERTVNALPLKGPADDTSFINWPPIVVKLSSTVLATLETQDDCGFSTHYLHGQHAMLIIPSPENKAI